MENWDVVIGMPSEFAEQYLLSHSFAGKIRVIRPGELSTCDYWPSRINLNVDENDVVCSVSFG